VVLGTSVFCPRVKGKCCCGLTEVVVGRKTSAGVTSCGARLGEIVDKLERAGRELKE